MLKKCILVTAGVLLGIISGCKHLQYESRGTVGEISVDGDVNDWETQSIYQLKSVPASLGLCHDAENLFLLIHVENPIMARNLREQGISLSFAEEDGDQPYLYIHYNGVDTLMSDPSDSFWQCMTEDQKIRFQAHRREMRNRIRIFQNGKSLQIPSDGSEGPAAAMLFQQGAMDYEFKYRYETMPINLTPSDRDWERQSKSGLNQVRKTRTKSR